MAKRIRQRPLDDYPIEVEGGRGYYTLEGRSITVHLHGGGSKTAAWSQTGNHDTLARLILLELIAEKNARSSDP